MPPFFRRLLPSGSLGTFAALACAKSGLSRLSRMRRPSEVCVLTFHGLVEDGAPDPELLDHQIHLSVSQFEQACEHLVRHYEVIRASDLVRAREEHRELPENAVVITFDDGFESNAKLGWPVLRRLGLPATIFLVSGYLDGACLPWFVRLELMLSRTRSKHFQDIPLVTFEQRQAAYGTLCCRIKDMPTTAVESLLTAAEQELGVAVRPGESLPAALRPMSWATARELQADGLVEFGGHTHTHPVLGRCSDEQAAFEIQTCQRRIAEELGRPAKVFAYPNGRPVDFNETTQHLLRDAGFGAAFTMVEGFVESHHQLYSLPRYGSPDSTAYLEALVSGSAQRLRETRQWLGLRRTKEAVA